MPLALTPSQFKYLNYFLIKRNYLRYRKTIFHWKDVTHTQELYLTKK